MSYFRLGWIFLITGITTSYFEYKLLLSWGSVAVPLACIPIVLLFAWSYIWLWAYLDKKQREKEKYITY